MGEGSWQSRVRRGLARSVEAGITVTTVGVLVIRYANHIPLHIASRKWVGNGGRPFSTPDRMRFYCLTQYLHWLGCEFSPSGARQPKTFSTVVRIKARKCPVCGGTFVHEKHVQTCSPACGAKLRRLPDPDA